MKKNLLIIIGFFLIIVMIISYFYYSYQKTLIIANQVNSEYEYYINNEISGSSLMTLINKVIDKNEKNGVEKDSNNRYTQDEENSIRVEVKFLESKKTYDMEAIAHFGAEAFIKNYNSMAFKCTKVDYYESNKQIKYMLFEQI